MDKNKDIFQMLLGGEAVSFTDPDYFQIVTACNETRKLLVQLNGALEGEDIRSLIGKITGSHVDATTMVFSAISNQLRQEHENR